MNEQNHEYNIRENLELQLENLLEDAEKYAAEGNEEKAKYHLNGIKSITKFLDADNEGIEKHEKTVKAHLAHILSDLAFNKIQYEEENEVRYAPINGKLYVDSEGIICAMTEKSFSPIVFPSIKQIDKKYFTETIKVRIPSAVKQPENDNGKLHIFIGKDHIATYDTEQTDKSKRLKMEKEGIPIKIKELYGDFLVYTEIPATRVGKHKTLIGRDGICYKEFNVYPPEKQAIIDGQRFVEYMLPDKPYPEVFKFHYNPVNETLKLDYAAVTRAYNLAKKEGRGYDEEMLEAALKLAKESDMDSEYFRETLLPSIEKRKTKASEWHKNYIQKI